MGSPSWACFRKQRCNNNLSATIIFAKQETSTICCELDGFPSWACFAKQRCNNNFSATIIFARQETSTTCCKLDRFPLLGMLSETTLQQTFVCHNHFCKARNINNLLQIRWVPPLGRAFRNNAATTKCMPRSFLQSKKHQQFVAN